MLRLPASLQEIGGRLILAAGLAAALPPLFVASIFVALAGRRGRAHQIFRGLSRALNGATDGDGDVTFSAQSAWNELRGKPYAVQRRWLVDALPGNGPGHCAAAMEWHLQRGLFRADNETG